MDWWLCSLVLAADSEPLIHMVVCHNPPSENASNDQTSQRIENSCSPSRAVTVHDGFLLTGWVISAVFQSAGCGRSSEAHKQLIPEVGTPVDTPVLLLFNAVHCYPKNLEADLAAPPLRFTSLLKTDELCNRKWGRQSLEIVTLWVSQHTNDTRLLKEMVFPSTLKVSSEIVFLWCLHQMLFALVSSLASKSCSMSIWMRKFDASTLTIASMEKHYVTSMINH